MKNFSLFLIVTLFFNSTLLAQCNINQYIQDNYELDAKILALRDILDDPSDPDYDNPFLPNERADYYLEKLSTIYENPNNDPDIDLLFDFFNFHVNQEYNYPIEYKTLIFRVATSLPWVEDFKNTGISGITQLDNLMSTYQFTVDNFSQYSSCMCTYFFVKTDFDFLNLYALIDDFEAIVEIDLAEVYVQDFNLRFNYTGIPYGSSELDDYAEVCDIILNEDIFTFTLYGGDCPAGCIGSEIIDIITVTDDCQVLTTATFKENIFSIYPNPSNDFITITSTNNQEEIVVNIFDISGKQILKNSLVKNKIDVSNLNPGVYIIKLSQNNKIENRKLVIQ